MPKQPGDKEFQDYLASKTTPDPAQPPMKHVDIGEVVRESRPDSTVRIALRHAGISVEAIREQFPADWVFAPGDIVGAEFRDQTWYTAPNMARTTVQGSRVTYYVANANGTERVLADVDRERF